MSDARTYRVRHSTEYTYPDPVSLSYGRAHLLPRAAPGQRVVAGEVVVDPRPDEQRDHVDHFGNVATYYAVRTAHDRLRVTAGSEVVVDRAVGEPAAADVAWEEVRDTLRSDVAVREFAVPSPAVAVAADVRAYAAQSFVPGRTVGSATRALLGRIHRDFAYVPGETTVDTTLTEVMARRRGVCQDFAHLLIGCLRSVGLPARYVSGYLETDPPPGLPRLQGADASHAWVAVALPAAQWLEVDPTNDQQVDNRYVTVAWGRDYTDVPPLKGVILTDAAGSQLRVAVDVVRLD